MKQYIDKSAVVAEIEKCYNESLKRAKIVDADYWNGHADAYRNLLTILDDTLETKEVDLDESARHYLLHEHISPLNEVLHQADLKVEMQYHKDIEDAYKAGFELGLKIKKGE